MQLRTAFYTIFGDYIGKDDGMITMPELSRLMGALGFSEEATKAAIYRMRHQQLVISFKRNDRTYYSLTEEGKVKMESGIARTFREPDDADWNGLWHVLIYSLPETERQQRDQLRKEISWLGFGQLTPGTWITPHDLSEQVKRIVKKHHIEEYVQLFESRHLGPPDADSLVSQAWNLPQINELYGVFISEFRPRLQTFPRNGWDDEKTFAERVALVHEYRKFLHVDPFLPRELLPAYWLGKEARRLFLEYYRLLSPGSVRFYESIRNDLCLKK